MKPINQLINQAEDYVRSYPLAVEDRKDQTLTTALFTSHLAHLINQECLVGGERQ